MECERYNILTCVYRCFPLELTGLYFYDEFPFIYDNKLCIMNEFYIQWDFESGKLVRKYKEDVYPGGDKKFVVRGNCAYFISE